MGARTGGLGFNSLAGHVNLGKSFHKRNDWGGEAKEQIDTEGSGWPVYYIGGREGWNVFSEGHMAVLPRGKSWFQVVPGICLDPRTMQVS